MLCCVLTQALHFGIYPLAHNELEDRIPVELGRLGNLEEVHLDDNRLDGEIPTVFAEKLPQLRIFYVTNNYIIGNLDGTFCHRPDLFAQLETLETDCLDEDLTCSCCTKCCDGSGYCCDKVSDVCREE